MDAIKLLVWDEGPEETGQKLAELLKGYSKATWRVRYEGNKESAKSPLAACLEKWEPDGVLLVVEPLDRFRTLLQTIRATSQTPAIFGVFGESTASGVISLLGEGMDDYLSPPFEAATVIPRIYRFLPRRSFVEGAEGVVALGRSRLIGESPSFLRQIESIPVIAEQDAGVLISGETGTGKEICAQVIHDLSARSKGPFVPVNCAALPTELFESELFGHEAGAYTTARERVPGLVREAAGGTLFLDEIDSMPLIVQAKMLRLIQEKQFRSLGARSSSSADIRLIAASNTNLAEVTLAGRFRSDLFYRLNVLTLRLPSLRDRPGDVEILTRHFLDQFRREQRKPHLLFTRPAFQRLDRHDWPGNVRELRNFVQRAVTMSKRWEIDVSDLELPEPARLIIRGSFRERKAQSTYAFEHELLLELRQTHANQTEAAVALGTDRRVLRRMLQKHKLRFHG